MITVKAIETGAFDRIDAMIRRAKPSATRSFLDRNVLQWYRNVQRKRWITENESEGMRWAPLQPAYRRRKLRVFAGYPGGGSKTLIATGRLLASVIGPGPDFRKVTTDRTMIIATVVPYAPHVNEDRTFTTYGEASIKRLAAAYARFLSRGENAPTE